MKEQVISRKKIAWGYAKQDTYNRSRLCWNKCR